MSHTSDMARYPKPTSFVQAVFAAANRAGLVPVDMSYFAAREGETVDYCRQRVREAELYVAVVGFRNGSLVPGTTVSYTETEFREAGTAGRERLVFLLDDDAPIPTSYVDEDRREVEAFRRRLRDEAGVVVATFNSVEQLELKVHHAFSVYLQRVPRPGPNGGSPQTDPGTTDDYPYMDRVARVAFFSAQRVADFRSAMRPNSGERIPPRLEAAEFLEQANLLRDGHLTNAGVLLFGEDPVAVMPHAIAQCARFDGETRTSPLESTDLRGTVPELIERARDFVGDHCRRGEVPSSDGVRTESVYDLPMIAIREVIANAFVHRDYERADSCVHVRVFSDRVEVVNPGTWGYPEAVGDGRYRLHQLPQEPSRRNFRLASVLRWSALVEGEGTGVIRAIDDSKDLGVPEPVVTLANNRVTVTIKRRRAEQTRPRWTQRRRRALLASVITAAVLATAALFLAARESGHPPATFGPTVAVGVANSAPGWDMKDDTGGRSGFDYDLTNWLGQSLRFAPVPVDVIAASRESDLQSGRVTLVVATYSITDSRSQRVTFAGPYMVGEQGVMVRAAERSRYGRLADLTGRTICTTNGSISATQLRGLSFPVSVIEQLTTTQCLDDLRTGRADAVSTDQLILFGLQQNNSDLYVPAGITFGQQQRYGVGLPKGDVKKCQAITEALKNFIDGGHWDTFFAKNLPGVDPQGHKPDPNHLLPCPA